MLRRALRCAAHGWQRSLGFGLAACLLAGCGRMPVPGMAARTALNERDCEAEVPLDATSWHIQKLYDCQSRTLYIPYELWSGAVWDGRRDGQCMHPVDRRAIYNTMLGSRVTGPHERVNPLTGLTEQFWKRAHFASDHEQFYTCNDDGVALVWDSRFAVNRSGDGCDFPAGPGWEPGEKRACGRYTVQITDVMLNEDDELIELEFRWWRGNVLDYVYRYRRHHGLTIAYKLPRDDPSQVKPRLQVVSQ